LYDSTKVWLLRTGLWKPNDGIQGSSIADGFPPEMSDLQCGAPLIADRSGNREYKEGLVSYRKNTRPDVFHTVLFTHFHFDFYSIYM